MRNWRNRFLGAVVSAILIPAAVAQELKRPETIAGHPNFNGVWQALNSAYWNLEAHNAAALDQFWPMGAIAAVPAGKTIVVPRVSVISIPTTKG